MPVETRPAPDARMLRPCTDLPTVPLEQLALMKLEKQVEWWRAWSLQVIISRTECAEDKDLWRVWYESGSRPLR